MNIKLLLVLITFPVLVWSQQSNFDKKQGNWLTNLEKAQQIAQQQNKNILMYFSGSDWCAPCKQLQKDFFDQPKFNKKSKELILVYVDVPMKEDVISKSQKAYNLKLVERFNKTKSFPLVSILNPNGKVLEQVRGYSPLRDTQYHEKLLNSYTK